MRALFALVPLALIAAPAAAAEPAPDNDFQIPSELTDPAMAQTLGKMLGLADQGDDGHADRRDAGRGRRP